MRNLTDSSRNGLECSAHSSVQSDLNMVSIDVLFLPDTYDDITSSRPCKSPKDPLDSSINDSDVQFGGWWPKPLISASGIEIGAYRCLPETCTRLENTSIFYSHSYGEDWESFSIAVQTAAFTHSCCNLIIL